MPLSIRKTGVRPLPGAVVRRFSAGGNISLGDWVYVDANGTVQAAQADAAGTAEAVGLVVSGQNEFINVSGDFSAGETVGVCLSGPVTGFSGMTPGDNVYVSASAAGGSVQAAPANPNYTKIGGRAVEADVLWVTATAAPVTEQTPA